jgi:hypothetical protein
MATICLTLVFYFRDKLVKQAKKDLDKVEKKLQQMDETRIEYQNQGDRLRDFIERNKA